MEISYSSLISSLGAIGTVLSTAWYLRGQLSKIAVSLAKIEEKLGNQQQRTNRNEEQLNSNARRIDNHEIRLALLEPALRESMQ